MTMSRHAFALSIAALLCVSSAGGCGSPASECARDADCASGERCISGGGVLTSGGTCVDVQVLRGEVGTRDASPGTERLPDVRPVDTHSPTDTDSGPSGTDADTGDARSRTDTDDANICPDGGCECRPGTEESCYTGPSGTADTGVCGAGSRRCRPDGTWGDCDEETTPASKDICDGLDNDCDGNIDEELQRNCGTSTGECETGTEICSNGSWGACQNNLAPSTESCDGKDNDCDGTIDEGVRTKFFRDRDGDSYGDPSTSKLACSPPTGYVSNDDDCYDQNARAHPGQTGWFAADRGDGSFDYNCDGNEARRWTEVYRCSKNSASTCSVDPEGWEGNGPPDCGKARGWIRTCSYDPQSDICSSALVVSRTQECL